MCAKSCEIIFHIPRSIIDPTKDANTIYLGIMAQPYESIVSQYLYKAGGASIPISKLVNMTALSTVLVGGGSANSNETGSALKRLEHLGVPAGLVFLPPKKHANIEYATNGGIAHDVIADDVYDKLVGLVSVDKEKKPKRGTRKCKLPK
jgi:hypothetical protein